MNILTVFAAVVALLLAGNGVYMLVLPETWYQSLPSVPHTGPLNVHFARDIGAAYLASGIGVAAGVWRPAWRQPAAMPALVFIGLHAALHLVEWGHAHPASAHEGWLDRVGLYAPAAFLLAWLLVPPRVAGPVDARRGQEARHV